MIAMGKVYGFLMFAFLLVLNNSSCDKIPDLPEVITSEVTEITQTHALSGGTVQYDGGTYVTDSGICWSTSENPTLADTKESCCAGTGFFIIRMKLLSANTKYYVRAYATNGEGTGYGNQVSFTTGGIATGGVITTKVSMIDLNSAVSGGYVFSDGGGPVTARGVCWSTSPNPTVLDSKTNEVLNSNKQYTSRLTDLAPGTNYFVRAYVTNETVTSYGYEVTFSTISNSPAEFNDDLSYGTLGDNDGNIYRTIQIGTQTWMAENLRTTKYNDGSVIPLISDNNTWWNRAAPAMCWYNNDPVAYKELFGGYYNNYAVLTNKLCPAGWHIPGKEEWSLLILYLGNEGYAGGKMKESGILHWLSPNYGADNESGFTGLAGGYRSYDFEQMGETANWWSIPSTYDYSGSYYDTYVLDYRYKSIIVGSRQYRYSYKTGLNVRCVRD